MLERRPADAKTASSFPELFADERCSTAVPPVAEEEPGSKTSEWEKRSAVSASPTWRMKRRDRGWRLKIVFVRYSL